MKHLNKFNESSDLIFTEVTIKIPKSAIKLMKKEGVLESKMAECYTQYIENSLEITYGQDKEYFETWCEESDNLVDYQEEYEDDDEFHGEGED